MELNHAVVAVSAFLGGYVGARRLRQQVRRLWWTVAGLARRVRHLEKAASREA